MLLRVIFRRPRKASAFLNFSLKAALPVIGRKEPLPLSLASTGSGEGVSVVSSPPGPPLVVAISKLPLTYTEGSASRSAIASGLNVRSMVETACGS